MAKPPLITQPTDQGVGQPPSRPSDILLTDVAKLRSDGEYAKRDLGEMRSDMKDVRDRLSRLEERVSHLPSKGFIIVVVTTFLVVIGGLLTIAPKLQSLVGTSFVSVQTAPQNPVKP